MGVQLLRLPPVVRLVAVVSAAWNWDDDATSRRVDSILLDAFYHAYAHRVRRPDDDCCCDPGDCQCDCEQKEER